MKQACIRNRKMRKVLTLAITVLAIFAVMAGCLQGCAKSSEISRYYKKLQRANSVTVEISITVPILGETKIVMQKDGNKTYTTGAALLSQPEVYTQTKGGTMYIYSKNIQGGWVMTSVDADTSNPVAIDDYKKFFNVSDYTYDEESDEYVMKDGISYEITEGIEASKVILSFNGDICNARGKVSASGILMPFTLTVKKLNATEITLPNAS